MQDQDVLLEPLIDNGVGPKSKHPAAHQVSYEFLFWVFFVLITFYCILDRFLWNPFPRGIGFPPVDDLPGLTRLFDLYGRATGRLFLTVVNFLFITQCKTTENWLMEKKPNWLFLGDLRTVHNRSHYILGLFFMAIPMLIHVLIVLVPAMGGIPLNFQPGRPKLKRTPFIAADGSLIMSHDDLFRLVLMVVLYGILFPLSISNKTRQKGFSLTQWLHIFSAFIFTFDYLRRSPHGQVTSTPVVAYYIFDRLLGLFWYRTGEATIIAKETLDDDYMVVFFYVPNQKRRRPIASGYYFQYPTLAEHGMEIAHPMVCFQNHTDSPLLPEWRSRDSSDTQHKFRVDSSQGKISRKDVNANEPDTALSRRTETTETDDAVFFNNWNTAAIIQVHRAVRHGSWSSRLCDTRQVGSKIRFWGPYLSDYGDLTYRFDNMPPLVLIGTGSGAPLILDFYMYISSHDIQLQQPVNVYFSANSIALFQFVTDLTCRRPVDNWNVSAHLTRHDDLQYEQGQGSRESDKVEIGRASFDEIIQGAPDNAEVYFCGHPSIQWKVGVACARKGLTYHPGHRYASEGEIDVQHIKGLKYKCLCTKLPCCCCY